MFNPQTASWTKLALHCRRTHYNLEQARTDQERGDVPVGVALLFHNLCVEEEERRHGYPRIHM